MLKAKYGILLVILLFGCQSSDILPKSTGHVYYPIRVGTYWEYSVVETTISQIGGQATVFYDLRLEVSDSVISDGETTYVVERSRRDQGTTTWVAVETWSVRLTSFQLVQQEGNTPVIKMEFPLSEGKAWNANALNNLGGPDACTDGSVACENYVVANLGKPFEIPGGVSYANSVTILENNDDDPIVMQDVRTSVYASAIGLVYHELSRLEYCTIGDCIGKKIVENGSLRKQTLTAYGGF